MYGPHIANMVLCALARLNLVVSSTTCASDSSQIDHVILEITSLGAPEICCHRSGPLGILSDQDSLLATTARCQWCSTTGSPSKGRVSFILVQNPERRPPELVVRLWERRVSRAGQAKRRKGHGRVFVGRAGLAAFYAAARAFEGRDVAEIGGPQANPESLISFSAAAGDGLQSTRSGLPRRKATRARDLVT